MADEKHIITIKFDPEKKSQYEEKFMEACIGAGYVAGGSYVMATDNPQSIITIGAACLIGNGIYKILSNGKGAGYYLKSLARKQLQKD